MTVCKIRQGYRFLLRWVFVIYISQGYLFMFVLVCIQIAYFLRVLWFLSFSPWTHVFPLILKSWLSDFPQFLFGVYLVSLWQPNTRVICGLDWDDTFYLFVQKITDGCPKLCINKWIFEGAWVWYCFLVFVFLVFFLFC